jgi:hypothetical protein
VSIIEDLQEKNSRTLGNYSRAWELLEKTSTLLKEQLEFLPASQVLLRTFGL